ncbi:MAG TPA: DUF2341 domain-containing protein [Chitinispirillaceae bacterium]|jgi:hypothetical protein|nr:DUF2341 domain-containing protein [Chitinispirillaceae bacterium]
MKKKIIYLVLMSVFVLLRCSGNGNLAGAGSETTNSLMGVIYQAGLKPVPNAHVHLFPSDYDAVKDGNLQKKLADTTDNQGRYLFKNLPEGTYVILARSNTENTSALVTGVRTNGDTVNVPDAVLETSGEIRVTLPEGKNDSTGYVYIPGTDIFAFLESENREVILGNVPPGKIPEIVYSTKENQSIQIIRSGIEVRPGDNVVVENPEWRFSKNIFFNTTSTGVSINQVVCNFPVLIRLTSANFDFSEARENGADIRFTKPDNSFLNFEIERWDRDAERAEVWVRVDTIIPNNNTQYIVMYWGNPECESTSDGSAVFDTAIGFQGVWHLGENGNTTSFDATYNRYDGTPHGMSERSSVNGIIGRAQSFDGISSHITMAGSADGKLNFPEDGSYSISLWAYAETIDSAWHGLAGKGHRQYYLQFKCFPDLSPSWEFVEYQDQVGWEFSEHFPSTTPVNGQWFYLTGVRDGNRQMLYVNGEIAVDTILINWNELSRVTGGDFTIGCHLNPDSLPALHGFNFFKGKIDEVRVISSVPDADWVRLCYMNQKEENVLVEFRQ